ncbi:NBR1-Ig-like domain-containing protein [Actinoplanes sp. NPDC049668]|uniref:NBR1-Ig-like domain-containing protein n=1 Tax=unclassified Actinoplanes TaxID=2626549 RepID=UPI0033B20245
MEDQDGTAAERFAEQLRTLRTAVGNPSFRRMAGRSGRISHTTLHEAAAGTRFPSWETTREFVRACEADEVQWRRRWEDAQPLGPAPAVEEPVLSGVVVPMNRGALQTADRDEVTDARRQRLPWLVAAAAVAAMIVVLGVTVRGNASRDGAGAGAGVLPPSPSKSSETLIPGDASRFVADVTIPDGTRVKVNARFVKVWAIANVGSVAWQGRYLAPANPGGDDEGCLVPDRVAIGDTAPGEQVMISVPVTAPSRPGQCWVAWKMVDEHGRPYFPSRRPVYFQVTVTA